MKEETKNRELIEAFVHSWNQLDFNGVVNALHSDIVYHNIPVQALSGIDVVMTYLKSSWTFSECDWQILNIAADKNIVLTERVDNFIINNTKISLPVMGTFELLGGKIFAWRDYFDLAMYEAQLEATKKIVRKKNIQ